MGTNVEATTVGLPTTKWLKKQLHSPNGHKKARLVLKVLNFGNRLVEQWARHGIALYHKWRGEFVIFDRYIYDAWVNNPARTFRQRLRKWLLEVGCPTPDLVVLLDAPADLLYRRKGEHTPELLERQRRGYLSLYDQIPQMFIVDATREADEVRRTVVSVICDRYRVRVAKKERNGHNNTAVH